MVSAQIYDENKINKIRKINNVFHVFDSLLLNSLQMYILIIEYNKLNNIVN